ncbi:origin recognition complex subunit 4 isoform X1 [Daphnia magna]|uniref:origin recognition complex subunit 4 isoform X1 n=1 Tax=Daphnia magna TaxID=35525 RepID=UPI001E1BCC5E|nr:origin recognition complex subunit 4 isoform X1 [Daphnia magna]
MTSCTDICRSILLERMVFNTHSSIAIPEDFLEHKNYVFNLLKSTVVNGENNSALLIGPRGSGKTMLINSVIADLEAICNFEKDYVVIKLHGFFQTDDRIAIQEITRQLFLEEETANRTFGSFSENLNFLLDSLKVADRKTTKSIIFIIDEFDQFCQHKNQTLLYNLFDVCQSAQAPMAVIGLTCRMDAISLFEKRVRSRFSHRQIYLLVKPDFQKYSETFVSLLRLQQSRELKAIYVRSWNKSVEDLAQDPLVQGSLKKLFNLNPKLRLLQNILLVALSRLGESHPFLSSKDIVTAIESQTTDCKTLQLQGLSVLELQLLLCMKYLDKIYFGEPCNYEMAFYEYTKQMKNSSMQKFDRQIAMKAMEHLETLEFIRPVEGISSSKVQKEFVVYHILITSEQLTAAIAKYPNLPTEVKQLADTCL